MAKFIGWRIYLHLAVIRPHQAPLSGRTLAISVKNWSVCAILRQNRQENEQKQHLCSILSRESDENEQTLHNLEKQRLYL